MELEGRGKKQQGFLAYLLSKLSTNTLSCMSECNTIHEEVIFVIVSNLARFLVDIFFTFCKEMKSFSHDFFTKFFSRDKMSQPMGSFFLEKARGEKESLSKDTRK